MYTSTTSSPVHDSMYKNEKKRCVITIFTCLGLYMCLSMRVWACHRRWPHWACRTSYRWSRHPAVMRPCTFSRKRRTRSGIATLPPGRSPWQPLWVKVVTRRSPCSTTSMVWKRACFYVDVLEAVVLKPLICVDAAVHSRLWSTSQWPSKTIQWSRPDLPVEIRAWAVLVRPLLHDCHRLWHQTQCKEGVLWL